MKAKKLVKLFILLILSIIILFLTALYIYDPLQVFHKSWRKDILFNKNMRQQAVGIINHYSFDSVIFGTSMLENTSADEASKLFGENFVNISMSASDFFERRLVLDYLLEHKRIKTVIYSLDTDKYVYQIHGNSKYPLENYSYLYDANPLNDIKVYLNSQYLKCLMKLSSSQKCIGDRKGLDRPTAWYQYKDHSVRFGGLDKWFAAKNNTQIQNAFRSISSTAKKVNDRKSISLVNMDKKISKAKDYINRYIIEVVKKHPKTNFLMAFPPYSRIYYARWAQYDKPAFKIHQAIVKYLAHKSEEFDNLSIYGFEDRNFVDDIANYKDPKHYHQSINSLMLKNILENKGLLNSSNVNLYLQTSKSKALDFDLIGLGKKIDIYLKLNRTK